MAQIFYEPKTRIFSNDGSQVGAGYKFYFYQTGTTTPVATYTTPALSVANSNPVIADSNGYLVPIYAADFSLIKVVVKDASDNTIYTQDPVNPSGTNNITLNDLGVRPTSYWGVTTGTSSAYTLVANPTISTYVNNQTFVIQVHTACAASPTLAIDGLTALNLKKYTGQGAKVALQAGDLQATERYSCINDGVDIVVLNPRSNVIYTGTFVPLTISAGAITLTNSGSTYTIDTEGAAATDDLDAINGRAVGQVIFLNSNDSSRDITLRHLTGGGNIFNPTGIPITLRTAVDQVCLKYTGTNWVIQYTNAASNLAAGYDISSNGIIRQFGYYTTPILPGNTAVVSFPFNFPNSLNCVLTQIAVTSGPNTALMPPRVTLFDLTSFTIFNEDPDTTLNTFFWEAIGY